MISVNEMLQTAKLFARRGNSGFDARGTALSSKHMNGLTFGEFCVLAADLKRFRTQCPPTTSSRKDSAYTSFGGSTNDQPSENGSKDKLKPTDGNAAPEVFLGGSCNPTTWRADVAIPTLQTLGISFYNPVSWNGFLFSLIEGEFCLFHVNKNVFSFSTASVGLDPRSDRAGASSEGKSKSIIFRYRFRNTSISWYDRSGLYRRTKFTAFSASSASIQARTMHFK